MDERIQELAHQARYDSRNDKHYLERVHNREITLDEYQEIYDKKFAELIIEECIVIMSREIDERESKEKNRTISDMMDLLERHFGVEVECDQEEQETCPRCGDIDSGTSCGIPNCGWKIEEQEKFAPKHKCSVCGTTENITYMGGYQPYLCDSVDCIPF